MATGGKEVLSALDLLAQMERLVKTDYQRSKILHEIEKYFC